jgi:hypothetical protein
VGISALSIPSPLVQQSQHLARVRVPFELRLLKYRSAIERDLELSAAGRNELDLRLREVFPDLGRQTGGPWLVVSNGAVLYRDLHGLVSECERASARTIVSLLRRYDYERNHRMSPDCMGHAK